MKTIKTLRLMLGVLTTASFFSAGADILPADKYYEIVKAASTDTPFKAEYPYMTDAQLAKLKSSIKSQRTPANVDGTARSQELIDLSDELMKINQMPIDKNNLTANADALDKYLAKLETNYATYKNADTKFFAAQLIPIRQLRGIVWKMIGLFEDKKTHPAHSLSLSAFKHISGDMRIFTPDESWRAGFDYITQPYVRNGALSKQFDNLGELQSFVGDTLFDKVSWSKDEIVKIDVNGKQPVIWNNQVAFGPKSFKDDVRQFKKIGELEKQMLLSDMFFSLSQMSYFRAYSMNGALELSHSFGRIYGLDTVIPYDRAEGITREDEHNVLKLNEFKQVGVGFTDREKYMNRALDNLRNATLALEAVWNQAKGRKDGTLWAINSNFLQLDHAYGDKKIAEFRRALHGPVTIRNAMTGESADINIPAFFKNSPAQLKDLLPKEPFDKGITNSGKEWVDIQITDKDTGKTYKAQYRDYMKGSAIHWDYAKYNALFPGVKDDADLKKRMRVMNASFGSFSQIGPLQAVR